MFCVKKQYGATESWALVLLWVLRLWPVVAALAAAEFLLEELLQEQ